MNYENILVEQENSIQVITINRPSKLNALNKATIEELSDALIASDKDTSVRVVIITGAGEKAFVAGADISEFSDFSVEEGKDLSKKGHDQLFSRIDQMKTPVIAAVNGFALGGGLELAMAAHIRIFSENARVGLPETSLGVIPGYGGTQRLAQIAGKGRAMEMILSSDMISAVEAKEWGLVNYVCSQEELIDIAEKIASKIKRNSPMAISRAIKSVNAGFINGTDGFEVEKKEFGSCFGHSEFIEGTTAFMEKRKPNF